MPALPDDSREPWRPMARHDHLVMTQTADEMLVYDTLRHVIHYLNPTSYAVWTACDGTRTLAGIGQVAGKTLGVEVSEDVVRLALNQLESATLLDGVLPTELQSQGQSRRVMLRRMAVAGGVALPLLASISAPAAADVDSTSCEGQGGLGLGVECSESSQCCTGYCAGGLCRVFVPPTPDTSVCGLSCSSDGDCFGACPRCTTFSPVEGVFLSQCRS